MLRSILTVALLLTLVGCGGVSPTLDVSRVEPVQGSTLLVYVVGTPDLSQATALTDSLGDGISQSFQTLVRSSLTEAVAFDTVLVQALPSDVVVERQKYNMIVRRGASRVRELRTFYAPPAGERLLGPDVPRYVVFLGDVSGRRHSELSTMGGGTTSSLSWGVSVRGSLWDNQTGAVVIGGMAQSRTGVRLTRPDATVDTWKDAIGGLGEQIADVLQLERRD